MKSILEAELEAQIATYKRKVAAFLGMEKVARSPKYSFQKELNLNRILTRRLIAQGILKYLEASLEKVYERKNALVQEVQGVPKES